MGEVFPELIKTLCDEKDEVWKGDFMHSLNVNVDCRLESHVYMMTWHQFNALSDITSKELEPYALLHLHVSFRSVIPLLSLKHISLSRSCETKGGAV